MSDQTFLFSLTHTRRARACQRNNPLGECYPPFRCTHDGVRVALSPPSYPILVPYVPLVANWRNLPPPGGRSPPFLSRRKENSSPTSDRAIREKERRKERKKEKEREDAGLYLSISGDRSVRGLDLRLGGCRQKCGLVYAAVVYTVAPIW